MYACMYMMKKLTQQLYKLSAKYDKADGTTVLMTCGPIKLSVIDRWVKVKYRDWKNIRAELNS